MRKTSLDCHIPFFFYFFDSCSWVLSLFVIYNKHVVKQSRASITSSANTAAIVYVNIVSTSVWSL